MSQLALDTGLGRESLHEALSADGNPEFATVLEVVRAPGLKFGAQPPGRLAEPGARGLSQAARAARLRPQRRAGAIMFNNA